MNADCSYTVIEKSNIVAAIGMIQVVDKHLTAFLNNPEMKDIGEIRTIGITTNVLPDGAVRVDIVGYFDEKVQIRNQWIDKES